MTKQVLLSAAKPTNALTLGNYIGALSNWVKLQDDYECFFSAVDLHSITVRQNPEELKEHTLFLLASYIACGIDPDKSTIFVQSHVPQHAELGWLLGCNTYMGELNRMTQFKDKSGKEGKNIPAGLFNYPFLMAADILLYDTAVVPVGEDQKQHIELCRDIVVRMNHYYGKEIFKLPTPYIPKIGARIMDLQEPTRKMGKSDSSENGAIYLRDTDKQIEKKIKRAVTDSGTVVTYSNENPGVKNLIDIQASLIGKEIDSIVSSYEGKMYGHLKADTAQIVIDTLAPIREKTNELLSDKGELMRILRSGAVKAREKAAVKLSQVYETIGFLGQ
ncbi:MAG: tryptophanyl-tRNA synthetase [Thermoproteota archaeon]|jgi:tryptophanyl-tRNA synthetase